jgi:hypothetical protein
MPAFAAREAPKPMEQDRRHATCFEYDLTTTRCFRQLIGDRPALSTVSCSRERPRLLGRQRRRGSRPSRCRGQQNSPLNGLLFRIVADPIALSGRVPARRKSIRPHPSAPSARRPWPESGSALEPLARPAESSRPLHYLEFARFSRKTRSRFSARAPECPRGLARRCVPPRGVRSAPEVCGAQATPRSPGCVGARFRARARIIEAESKSLQ